MKVADIAANLESNAPGQFARFQVLGCMIERSDLMGLTDRHFVGYDDQSVLFRMISLCAAQEIDLTPPAIAQMALQENISTAKVSESTRIAVACAMRDSNVNPAIAVLKRDLFLRDMKSVGATLMGKSEQLENSLVKEKFQELATETIDQINESFMRLFSQSGLPELPLAPVGATDPMQVVEESREKYRKEDADSYSGFPQYAKLIEMGESVETVAAPTSLGKTSFVLAEAYNTAKSGRPVLYFSTEMPEEAVIKRLIAIENPHVPLDQLFQRKLVDLHFDSARLSVKRLGPFPFFYHDGLLSVREMLAIAKRLDRFLRTGATEVMGHGLHIEHNHLVTTYIDFLQQTNLAAYGGGTNRDYQITLAMTDVRRGASATKSRWVVVSQLNREVNKRGKDSREPQLSDLRESGSIESMSNTVTFLHRDSYYDDAEEAVELGDEEKLSRVEMDQDAERNKTWLIIRKNRNGRRNVKIPIRFVPERACYFPYASSHLDKLVDAQERTRGYFDDLDAPLPDLPPIPED